MVSYTCHGVVRNGGKTTRKEPNSKSLAGVGDQMRTHQTNCMRIIFYPSATRTPADMTEPCVSRSGNLNPLQS